MSNHTKKYLVTGCTQGHAFKVLLKLKEVNEKNGPFSAAFILGGPPTLEEDLTGLFDVVKSDYYSSFPVYFLAGSTNKGLLEDSLIEELSQRNIHFSRPFGVSKTPEGLRFAFISGSEDQKSGKGLIQLKKADLEFVEEQYLISEENEAEGVIDMLFSWSWPTNILSENTGFPVSKSLSPVLYRLKPRYIFCPSHSNDFHFERAPFENLDSKTSDFMHATRFISLADCFNENQKKWVYALSIEPAKHANYLTLSKKPENCTTNPFDPSLSKPEAEARTQKSTNYFFQVPHDAVIGSKRRLEDNSSSPIPLKKPPSGYICKKCRSSDHYYRDCQYQDSKYGTEKPTYVCHICHEPGHNIRDCPKKQETSQVRSKDVSPENCWFCLSNPASRKHLIVDIGDEVYLTLAKGPLTPDHSIIIPIEHIPSNANEISTEVDDEIKSFMKNINSSLSLKNKTPIFFRLRHNPSHHYHIQMIPIANDKLDQFLDFFKDYSANLNYKFDSEILSVPSFEFLFFKNDQIQSLSHTFEHDTFFPAQFGRQVLAAFLNVSERSDWKSQTYTEADEKEFVSNLKKLFCRGK